MSKTKITGKILAIQLGRDETRIALMGNNATILHSLAVDTPAGAVEDGAIRNYDAIKDLLKNVLRTPEFSRVRQVVFSLCTTQVISETITTPDLPVSRLEKLIQANVDTYFPVDMQDYKIVWQVIGPQTKDSGLKELRVQLWAVPNAILNRYYTVANACGLSVVAVDYCGHSMATAVGATFARTAKAARTEQKFSLNMELSFGKKKNAEESSKAGAAVATEERQVSETDLHLYLEKDLLGMTFVQNGQVVQQRFIRCGADPSYQMDELAMNLEYFQALDIGRGSKINGMMSGSLVRDSRFVAELEDLLGISLTVARLNYDSQWIMCVGAAGTTLDFGSATLNRSGRAPNQIQSQIWQYAAVLVGGLLLIASVLYLFSARLMWSGEIHSLESKQNTLTIQAQMTAGFADNYKKYSATYDSYSADWDTVFSSLRTYNDNLVLVLEELEKTLPENASVTNLQIAADGLTVEFACEDKEVAAYLIMALRKLQYMDLVSISNLSGGGAGPATSYGPKNEKAPTEGSSETGSLGDEVQDIIASELTQEELLQFGLSLTEEEVALLEEVYGRQPETGYETMEPLRVEFAASLAGKDKDAIAAAEAEFFTQRSDALREMLSTNPFAVNGFIDLMEEDFYRASSDEEVILWWHILEDLIRLEEEGKLEIGTVDNIESLRNYVNILADVLTKDETTLYATERLLGTDESMEQWYIYYLEVEMGKREAELLPYLNMERVVQDLLSGGFNTGNPDLDAKMNALISDETWAKLEKLSSREGLAELLNQYLTTGTTGDAQIDALIERYMTTGTTGYTYLDNIINEYITSGELDGVVAALVEKYLTEGTTGNEALDARIDSYLITGTTGSDALDALIEDYIDSDLVKDMMVQLMENYLSTGSTGSETVDLLIEQYLTTGTAGNEKLDAMIAEFIRSGSINDKLTQLLEKYIAEGTTGVDALDALINKYLTEGTTGNEALDQVIEDYIKVIAESFTEEQIAEMMQNYINNGTTGNALYDMLIKKYMEEGTTGIDALDALIKKFLEGTGGEEEGFTKEMVEELLRKYMEEGTTGNALYDSLIERYLNTGSTGIEELDKLIETYVNQMIGSVTKEQIGKLIEKYIKDGTTGNALYDALINKYLKTGSTGIDALDAMIEAYFKNQDDDNGGFTKEMVEEMIKKYMKNGTTGNTMYDSLIEKYLTTGTTGNKVLDKLIEDYMDTAIKSISDKEISDMMKKYLTTGTTGNKLYDRLIKRYLEDGTTGFAKLDALIKKYMNQLGSGDVDDDIIGDILGGLLGGGTGNIGGKPDTRIFFTVNLAYNDELKNAELARKGLFYNNKISKLEVDGE